MFLFSSPVSRMRFRVALLGLLIISLLAGGWYFFIFRPNALLSREKVTPPPVATITKTVFGSSVQNRPIEGYVIGNGAETLFLFGAIHGQEMGTADLLKQLVLEIALNPRLVAPSKKLVIIPVANPDGYFERADNLNANGVNLNLNFGATDWQKYGPEGNFAGLEPFSEPESRVLKAAVETYKPFLMISFHSHGNLVSPEKGDASVSWAQWYSRQSGYKYFDEWDYPGMATKWFTEITGQPSFTVEISKDLQSDWDINKSALLELIGYTDSIVLER